MFYIPDLLQKKGPWAMVWLAGTYPSRIQNRHIQNTSVYALCKDILNSDVPLSLRLSSLLMSGLVYIYHQQTKKLCNDMATKLREISVSFLPRGLKQKNRRTKARAEDITLQVTDEAIHGSMWTDFSEISFSGLGEDALVSYIQPHDITIATPGRKMSTTLNLQANIDDITLPDFEQFDLQFEADDYDFQFFGEVEPPTTEAEPSGLIPESPVPFHFSPVLTQLDPMNINIQDISEQNIQEDQRVAEIDNISLVHPVSSQLHENQEQQDIQNEDDAFNAEQTERRREAGSMRNLSLKFDRRITMNSEELRATIDDPSEFITERPHTTIISNESSKESFHKFSASAAQELCTSLLDTWHFLAFDLGRNKEFLIFEEEEELFSPDNSKDHSDIFLPDIQWDSNAQAVEELRAGVLEDTIEYRKASIASIAHPSTPFDYVEDPNQGFYESTPLRQQSPLSARHSSPLPQRRASSIQPNPQYSPMYAEPQYFEPQSFGMGGIPSAPVPALELISSINENSVKMLKYVRSKLKQTSAIDFSEISMNMNKQQAAKSFFQLLVLSSTGYLDCLQTAPYGEITIRAGDSLL